MRVPEAIVDVLETIEIEKEHCEHVIVAPLRTFDLGLEQFSEHGAIRKPGK